MKHLLDCRRTFLGAFGMVCLTFLGYTKGIDVGMAIAAISMGVSGANAYQKLKGVANASTVK